MLAPVLVACIAKASPIPEDAPVIMIFLAFNESKFFYFFHFTLQPTAVISG
jgi:hypothetical protein